MCVCVLRERSAMFCVHLTWQKDLREFPVSYKTVYFIYRQSLMTMQRWTLNDCTASSLKRNRYRINHRTIYSVWRLTPKCIVRESKANHGPWRSLNKKFSWKYPSFMHKGKDKWTYKLSDPWLTTDHCTAKPEWTREVCQGQICCERALQGKKKEIVSMAIVNPMMPKTKWRTDGVWANPCPWITPGLKRGDILTGTNVSKAQANAMRVMHMDHSMTIKYPGP